MYEKKKYTIDFRSVRYYPEMHKEIQRALEFPYHYGCNWSAFWDCLTDMYGESIHIEIIGFETVNQKFGDAASKMIEILERFKHFNDDLFADDIHIEIVNEGSRIILS